MSDSMPRLGCCPFCGATITQGAVLIEYDVDGDTHRFAECPDCGEPLAPE